jgi:2-methylcitrate dehydratase PrpD
MIKSNLDSLSHFIMTASPRAFPPDVVDAAKQCLVDWFAVGIAAMDDPGPRIVREHTLAWKTQGAALSLYGDRCAAAMAALINGTLAHSLDYDDLHLGTAYHASGPTLAAALAVGMDRQHSERDILSAFIVGFEVGTVAGEGGIGVNLAHNGWHPTGVLGHLSATAAAAALLRLDRTQIANAFGLAATQSAGLMASAGSMAKPFHVGKAAMNGVIAAELAARGLDASHDMLDNETTGLFASLRQQKLRSQLDSLGQVWQITRNTFKPYAACQLTHAPFETAQRLKNEFRGKRVRAIRAFVNPLAPKIAGKTHPQTPNEAKFSIAYCVALGLSGHAAIPSDFSAAQIADAALMNVVDRVEVVPTEAMERWAARVEVDCEDGTALAAEIQAALGSLDRPLGWPELESKFITVAEPVYGDNARRLLAGLRSFDQPGRLAEIAAMLERPTARF